MSTRSLASCPGSLAGHSLRPLVWWQQTSHTEVSRRRHLVCKPSPGEIPSKSGASWRRSRYLPFGNIARFIPVAHSPSFWMGAVKNLARPGNPLGEHHPKGTGVPHFFWRTLCRKAVCLYRPRPSEWPQQRVCCWVVEACAVSLDLPRGSRCCFAQEMRWQACPVDADFNPHHIHWRHDGKR